MVHSPILTLQNISYGIGSETLFEDVDLTIVEGDRIALVGRNGAGKSSFMKLLAGTSEPDQGSRILRSGIEISMLEQNPDFSKFNRLFDFASEGMSEHELYAVESAFAGLGLSTDLTVDFSSGGEMRKAALAKLISKDADLWLIDEPTNHLDIQSIEWLENTLNAKRDGAYVIISHDRRFLSKLSRTILWIDRTKIRRKNESYEMFEEWRDDFYAQELARWKKEDKFIEDERIWSIEGISARRKRNQRRVRRLHSMQQVQSSRLKQESRAELFLGDSDRSGKLIVELKNASKSYQKPIFRDFSLKITRGERIAIVGPNGAGKSTLVRILLGLEEVDSGRFKQGLNQQVAYFDQARTKFRTGATLASALTEDPKLAVSGQSDQVMVRGEPRHIFGYLKAFLFKPSQVKSAVSTLSGGERARLILAKIMAEESNILVLDEPTNDLDVETLDLLQETIDDYSGTVILVSHDRDFVDRIAERTIFMNGHGNAEIYAGGWSDLVNQGGGFEKLNSVTKLEKKKVVRPKDGSNKPVEPKKMTFVDQFRLDELPFEIERLEKEIAKLEELLADPNLYTDNPVKFSKAIGMLEDRQVQLVESEEEWLQLEEKRAEFDR